MIILRRCSHLIERLRGAKRFKILSSAAFFGSHHDAECRPPRNPAPQTIASQEQRRFRGKRLRPFFGRRIFPAPAAARPGLAPAAADFRTAATGRAAYAAKTCVDFSPLRARAPRTGAKPRQASAKARTPPPASGTPMYFPEYAHQLEAAGGRWRRTGIHPRHPAVGGALRGAVQVGPPTQPARGAGFSFHGVALPEATEVRELTRVALRLRGSPRFLRL